VRINIAGMSDRPRGDAIVQEAAQLVERAARHTRISTAAVERAIGA
jgi:hypothetical protein